MGYSFKWILEHLSQSFVVASASYAANAGTASYAIYAANAGTASYVTASNVYGLYGSNSILSASWALTAAYAMNGGSGGGGTPGGANTTIQFNSGGYFSGSTNFTFISQSNAVRLTGSLYITASGTTPAVTITQKNSGTTGVFFVHGPSGNTKFAYDLPFSSTGIYVIPYESATGRISGTNYGSAGFQILGAASHLILQTDSVTAPIRLLPGTTGGGNVLLSGSLYVTNSVYFSGLTTTAQTNVLTINPTTGQIFYTASNAFATTPGINGIDQYISRFSGSNQLETSSVFNDRSLLSLKSGHLPSLFTDADISVVFGSGSWIYNNAQAISAAQPRITAAHSFGKYNTNHGSNIGFSANYATSNVGAYDFVQNLLASSAPRIHFSSYYSGGQILYAPFAGDLHYLGQSQRTNYAIVADLNNGDIMRVIGIYYPITDSDILINTVADANFVDSSGGANYTGLTINFSSIDEYIQGGGVNTQTNGNIVCFFLDGGPDGFFDTNANTAKNIATSAHGYGTHAEGYYTQTRGHYTHAENNNTVAVGSGSRASGYKTVGAGRYGNANNIFTAAGPTYYVKNAIIRRSNYNQNSYDYYYSVGIEQVGSPNPTDYVSNITWIADNELGTRFNNAGFSSHTQAIKCVIQIPSLDYIGIVELFAGEYDSDRYVTTLLDILPDGISSSIANTYITPIDTNTFFETYDSQYGGGSGYGAFSIGVETISTNSGSFAGGISTKTYGSGSFTYGQDLNNTHNNSFLFGRDADSAADDSFLFSVNGSSNLYANDYFVGINTLALPNSGYRGISIIGTASVSNDLFVNANSYLGNGISDVTTITGSLIVSNSYQLIGTGNVTGSLIVSNSLRTIGTSQVTGSLIVSNSLNVIGTSRVTGSLIVSTSLNTIGTNTTTGSLFITGSSRLIGDSTITGSILMTGSAAISKVNYIDFVTSSVHPHLVGRIHWDNDYGTLNIDLDSTSGNEVMTKVGQDNFYYIKNQTGVTLTKGKVI